ncbi:MAG: hypothetical protein JNL60_08925 [Bacteroidia bacterium]|nr:hypothetical protein [Bacteroidia bacterium]
MKTYKNLLFFALLLTYISSKADTLRIRKDFLELRAGGVFYNRAWGKDGNYNATDKATGVFSQTFGVGGGKCIKNFVFGFYFDYTKFNLVGDTKQLHYQSYKTNTWIPTYNVYQKISYYDVNSGLAFYYRIRLKKFFMLAGPSIYFRYYRSPVMIRNYYASEQPNYNGPRPLEGVSYQAWPAESFERFVPYLGFNVNINLFLNKRWSLAIYGSLFYNTNLGLYHKGTENMGSNSTELPNHYLYYLMYQKWITSGLNLMYWF